MALNQIKRVTEIDPETGSLKPVRGLYSQECGSYKVTIGAMVKSFTDVEYVADFQVNKDRFRRALCRESDFANEMRFNRKTGSWENPAFERAKTMLKEYRDSPIKRNEEIKLRNQAEEEAKRQKALSSSENNRTVSDLIAEYRPFIESKVKPSSYPSIKGHLNRINADLGLIRLADLSLRQLENWQATMKRIPRESRAKPREADILSNRKKSTKSPASPDKLPPLSPLTVNRHIQTLKAMMTKAHDWGWINESQLHLARKIRLDQEADRRRLDFLSRDEAENLINAADKAISPVIICALQTGMRKEEILSLKWSQVDLDHRIIHLPKTKSGKPRSLPINDLLLAIFRDNTLIRSINDDHVFLNPKTKTRWSDLKTPFNRAVNRAKLSHKGIVFHHLRHTAASWMVMAGVPLLTVARVLGHADVQMVSRYSHLTPDHMGAAVGTLDGSTQTMVPRSDQSARAALQ